MDTVPDDVILLIGDCLEDRGDCYNAVLVSRRFHTLFSRALFRSAALKNLVQVQLLLKAIVRQPRLASVIRSLDLSLWESAPAQPIFSPDDLAQLSTWTKDFSYSQEEHLQWERDLLDNEEEAWIALVLSLANNIKQLKLAYPRENKYINRMFDRAVNLGSSHERPVFLRLEEVSLSHMEDELSKGSFSPAQLRPFFQMPSMRSVSADTVIEPVLSNGDNAPIADEEANQSLAEELSQTSQITEITLNTSNASHGLDTLLNMCPSLNSLKYQHSDDHALALGFQPSSFFSSLSSTTKPNLQTLWLDNLGTHHAFTSNGLNETYDGYFGSLAEFTALKDLRIRLPNLLDAGYTFEPATPLTEILPSSIERVYVESCKENSLPMLVEQLRSLLEVRKERFKGLQRVDIEGFFHVDDEDLDDSGADGGAGTGARVIKEQVFEVAKPLREACEDAGVQLFLRDRACAQTMVEA
ncbi:hypothetical protein BJY01DRAFT_235704 [Aspergillus pseudoustus]|uniref:Leucine-rich repeat domain-containing protein n=1 Tax=Aspergillus pseudoustus TaxID=1810923 RepID=A0ABR4JU05_9EURO